MEQIRAGFLWDTSKSKFLFSFKSKSFDEKLVSVYKTKSERFFAVMEDSTIKMLGWSTDFFSGSAATSLAWEYQCPIELIKRYIDIPEA